METPTIRQGQADLARGLELHSHGPALDALASLELAGRFLAGRPADTLTAALAALDVAWTAGDHTACLEALASARDVAADDPAHDYLLGMLALLTERPDDAAPLLRAAVRAGTALHHTTGLLLACDAALLLGDVRTAASTGARALALARSAGDEPTQARASERVAYAELRAGRHAAAREHATSGLRAAWRSGSVNTAAHHHAVLALVASVQGPLDDAAHHAASALRIARRHGLSQPVTLAEWALARCEIARGRPGDAAARLGTLLRSDGGAHFALRGLIIPTYVEAAAGAGTTTDLAGWVGELAAWSRSAADPHGPALVLRCRALTAHDSRADDLFRQADAAHEQADAERARTALMHGMWLRRRRRPVDSRERLHEALLLFERCGAAPWAALARAELRAAGAPTGPEPDRADTGGAALAGLTPHQRRIAHCVAAGDTNRDVATRLGVSVRTVDSHLRNIFVALGIRSRTELTRLVLRDP
jgi:DNA-binding CsgD family transcriptional regulator/tetratricopeptide (TPR) repeat protein